MNELGDYSYIWAELNREALEWTRQQEYDYLYIERENQDEIRSPALDADYRARVK